MTGDKDHDEIYERNNMIVAQISSSHMTCDKDDHDDGTWRYTLEPEEILFSVSFDCDGLFPGYIGQFAVMPSFYRGSSIKD